MKNIPLAPVFNDWRRLPDPPSVGFTGMPQEYAPALTYAPGGGYLIGFRIRERDDDGQAIDVWYINLGGRVEKLHPQPQFVAAVKDFGRCPFEERRVE
jgi:hypothetical protein